MLTSEAAFAATCFRIQDWLYGLQRTRWKFIVIPFIPRCCTSKHNEIAILTARCALIWIMLKGKIKINKCVNYLRVMRSCFRETNLNYKWLINDRNTASIPILFWCKNNTRENLFVLKHTFYETTTHALEQFDICQMLTNKINIINHFDE